MGRLRNVTSERQLPEIFTPLDYLTPDFKDLGSGKAARRVGIAAYPFPLLVGNNVSYSVPSRNSSYEKIGQV
jgi:hypothetical protein